MRGYKSFDGTPHPGDLRHRVKIGYTKNVINSNGYPEPTDVVVCSVWASAIDAGNQHYRSADVMNTEQVINFTIRYRSDVPLAYRNIRLTLSAAEPFVRWSLPLKCIQESLRFPTLP